MSDTQLLYKYLDAGAKSSAVVLDPSLDTGNEQTLYLYHQQRNQIIEYRRDIVEAKLRELSGDEQKETATLQQAYQQTRLDFTPRGGKIIIPEQAPPAKAAAPRSSDDDDDSDDDIGLIGDDDLLDDDGEDEVDDED